MHRHAEIAGAGFTGLVAAIALAQSGWSVRVHERARELREFGAGIFLWQNGLRVLQAIGAHDAVLANIYEAPSFDDVDDTGSLIASRPLPIPGAGRMVTMTRRNLYAPILQLARDCGVEIVVGSEIVGADPQGWLLGERGERHRADLVVGADGIRSKVRESLDIQVTHEVFPVKILRTLVRRTAEEVRNPYWNRYVNFWSDTRRVLYVPCDDENLYVMLASRPGDAATQVPLDVDTWGRTFPMLVDTFSRMHGSLRVDHYELIRCSRWSSGRVVLIGDAAHAMPPTIGQGAGSGMMNALSLAQALEGNEVLGVLPEWEQRERPMVEHTQSFSAARANQWKPAAAERVDWKADEIRTAMYAPQ